MSERDGEPVVKKQRTSLHSAELRLDLEDDTTLLDLDEDLSWMTRCCEQLLASSSVSSSSTSSSSSSSSSSSLSIISGDESNDSVDLAVVATQASACEFDAFGFMASVPDRSHFRPQICEIERRGALLAHRDANDARPTLVLDLDETLVHSSVVPMEGAVKRERKEKVIFFGSRSARTLFSPSKWKKVEQQDRSQCMRRSGRFAISF
jgi:hypothetical protein